MTKFCIEIFNKKPKKISGTLYCQAKINIGDYSEKFYIPIDYWNIDQYKEQWKEGLARLKDHDVSCLIASVKIRNKNIGTNIWILYKVNDKIFVQNHMKLNKLDKKIKRGFDFYSPILPRKIPKKNGPDEWSISADNFFASIDENIKELES